MGGAQDCVDGFLRSERIDGNREVGSAVERQAALVAGGEVGLIGENGPRLLGSLAALEGCGQFHFEMDEQRSRSGEQLRARGLVLDGSAAESENQRVACGKTRDDSALALAEGRFAVAREELGDGYASFGLDYVVHIDEAPTEAGGDKRADGGFARAHEAGEDDAAGRGGLG